MILKSSVSGSARELAVHLLKVADYEHAEVYEVRGFASDDLTDALIEAIMIWVEVKSPTYWERVKEQLDVLHQH